MKIKKKLASLITVSITAASVLSCAGSVYAAGNAEMEYVKSILGKYLSDTEYASLEGVALSDAFDLYDLETMTVCDKDIFVTYHDNTVIGIMCVCLVNGNYRSTFQEFNPNCVQNAYDNETDIAFCCDNGKSLIYDGEEFYNTQTNEIETYDTDHADSILVDSLSSVYCNLQDYAVRTRSNTLIMALSDLDMLKPVDNENINGGICWAASIATKYNYVNRLDVNDTGYKAALDIYTPISIASGSTPTGIPHYYSIGFQMFHLLDTYYAGSIPGVAVYQELYHDNPVIIDVFGTGTNGTLYGHSLVIGMIEYTDDDTAIYTVADSNYGVLQEADVNSNADLSSDDFEYNPGAYSCVFTEWNRTYSYRTENSYIGS